MRKLSGRVRVSEPDAAAARILAGAADRDVEEFRGELRDVRGELHNFRRATTTSFNALREDLTDLRGDVTNLRGNLTDLHGDLTGLHGDVTDLRGGPAVSVPGFHHWSRRCPERSRPYRAGSADRAEKTPGGGYIQKSEFVVTIAGRVEATQSPVLR